MHAKNSICIITSVHPVFDTRIFFKEAKTLVNANYDVSLIAQHDEDEIVDGVKIFALKKQSNRFLRIFILAKQAYDIAFKQNADIYHFHDPEFLPWAEKLRKKTGAKVIYDIHEYVSGQILNKEWIPKFFREPVSKLYQLIEKRLLPSIDWVIFAEDSYPKLYKGYGNVSVVRNYPLVSKELLKNKVKIQYNFPKLVYVGRVSRERGIFEIIDVTKSLKDKFRNISLNIIGPISDNIKMEVKNKISRLNLNQSINLLGQIPHPEALKIIAEANIGLCILYPIPNYIRSLSTKLFEYMIVGLPVVTSNFPLWKEIVEGNDCGLTVSPLALKEISEALEYLIEHPEEARKMGENGRRAVIEKYNWETEGKTLIETYRKLIEV